jgi:hypothetical protein
VVLLEHEHADSAVRNALVNQCILSDYLEYASAKSLVIKSYLLCNDVPDYTSTLPHVTPVPLAKNIVNNPDAAVKAIADATDADIVLSKAVPSSAACVAVHRLIVTDIPTLMTQLEIFARGWEVPWSFSMPAYNLTWQDGLYLLVDELGKMTAKIYHEKLKGRLGDSETDENARSLLLDRISFLCYTRDKLLFYSQQLRHSLRNGFDSQEYRFEISYHLQNYYGLISGALDQLSRVIHKVLRLTKPPVRFASLRNADFIKNVSQRIPDIRRTVEAPDVADWLEKLSEIRNYIIHAGAVTASPIYEKPENELSDADLENGSGHL